MFEFYYPSMPKDFLSRPCKERKFSCAGGTGLKSDENTSECQHSEPFSPLEGWRCQHLLVFSLPEGLKEIFAIVFARFELLFSSIWEDFPSLHGREEKSLSGLEEWTSNLTSPPLANFLAGFSIDILEKWAEKIAHLATGHKCPNCDHVGGWGNSMFLYNAGSALWAVKLPLQVCHDCELPFKRQIIC